jgi:HTH-type transcriptional regulator / antitoxin HipB
MRIRTPTDLGAIIRDSRIKLGLDQKSLADRIGVSREWIVEIEKGKPRAHIGLVLRAFNALGITLDARPESASPNKSSARSANTSVDIDSIVAAARKPRK